MLICEQCNKEQETGKFCGQCGGKLVEKDAGMQHEPADAPQQTTTAVQQKNAFQAYFNFIQNVAKNPTQALKLDESQFGYGLITAAVFALAYALANYFLANKMVKDMLGPLMSSLPFFDITVPLLFFIVLFLAGAWASVFAASKLMNSSVSVKAMLAQFGGLLVPFMLINLAMILFGIAGMAKIMIGLTTISIVFSIYFLPMMLSFYNGMKANSGQKVYFSLGAAALSMLISYIIVRLAILDFLEKFDDIYPWF